jgi:hypothetical protein
MVARTKALVTSSMTEIGPGPPHRPLESKVVGARKG